ncbi:MAG: hypothetical protein Q9212_002591 [Teloschistes hypoglaucus]
MDDDPQKWGEGAAAESDDIKYGKMWSDVVSEGPCGQPQHWWRFPRVRILLLCWEHATEMKSEIERLASFLELSFAAVTCVYLRLKPGQWIQDCLKEHISLFVEDNEEYRQVMVYYAGHGQPGGTFDASGLLGLDFETSFKNASLADKSRPGSRWRDQQSSSQSRNQLDWNETVLYLQGARPRIIGFFDCNRTGNPESHEGHARPETNGEHKVTLQYDFTAKPSQEQLETLARELNDVFERNTLGVMAVQWKGIAPVEKPGSATGKESKPLIDF